MATDTSKAHRKPNKRRAADGFVMMAMALVTLALCIGLVLQAGLSFWLAVTVSAAFYIGLLTLHTLARRHDQLDEMRAEIERLKADVAKFGASPAARAGQPVAIDPETAKGGSLPQNPTAPAPRSDERPTSKPAFGRDGPAMFEDGAQAPGAANAPRDLGRQQKSQDPRSPQQAIPPIPLAPAPAHPPVVRAPHPGAMQRRPVGPDAPLAGSVLPPDDGQPPSAGYPNMAGINRVRRDVNATGRAMFAPASIPPVPATTPNDPVSHADAPGNSKAAPGQSPAIRQTTAAPAAAMPGTDVASAVDGGPPQTEPWTFRPGDDAHAPTFSPREADVEMIQGLIKKLADEVNASDAEKLALRRKGAANEASLDESVGALRRTAAVMKDGQRDGAPVAAPASSGSPQTSAQSVPPPLPGLGNHVQRTGREASGKPAMDGPITTAHTAPPEESTPEFDVDALMRRAKPIATMTSMPPPLPSAPSDERGHAQNVATNAKRDLDQSAFDSDTADELSTFEAERAAAAQPVDAERDNEDVWAAIGSLDDESLEHEDATNEDNRLALIADAIEAGRVDVMLEPILSLENNQPRHYEVSVRLRDAGGQEIVLDDNSGIDQGSEALPLLDSLRLRRTAHVAMRLDERKKTGSVFSTFSGSSLTSDQFLTEFADTYDERESVSGQLVLTFSQADVRGFRTPHWTMMEEMRDLGFGFALRAVTDLDMDFEQLASSGFKFVKLDADVFLKGMPAPGSMLPASDICKYLAGEGLTLVVEALDDDTKRARVFGFGVLFGQGQLFGGPRLMKSTAVTDKRSAAA